MRLFVAVPLDEQIKRKMMRVRDRISVGDARVRWCTAEQLHLTLKFIGEVEDNRVAPICKVVQQLAENTSPFDMEIAGTGCFPSQGPVRVIWIGSSTASDSLHQAVQQLESDLEALGIAREKRTFSEHFTIGRVKFDRSRGRLRESVLAAPFEKCRQGVREVALYQSLLARTGAQYVSVSRAALNG